MSIDLTGARAALTAIFQTRTLRRADGSTERCGVSSAGSSGATDDGYGYQPAVITIPGGGAAALDRYEVVTIDEAPGRRWLIIAAPLPGNLDLSRAYRAEELPPADRSVVIRRGATALAPQPAALLIRRPRDLADSQARSDTARQSRAVALLWGGTALDVQPDDALTIDGTRYRVTFVHPDRAHSTVADLEVAQ